MVTRRLSFLLFLRIAIALALAVGLLAWLKPHGWFAWLVAVVLLIVWAAVNGVLLSRAIQRDVGVLEAAVSAIPEREISAPTLEFSDFGGPSRALAEASARVARALADASESRSELAAMIDSMQDAVIAVDSGGRIQWANQKMQRMMSGAASGNMVRVGHALVQTVRDPEVLDCVRVALEERAVCELRSTTLLPGKIFEVIASPMPGSGAVAVLHDITRIEQVERAQREFVANVSHELRTPLTSISGYVETLLDHEASLSPQAREFLTTIHNNATRMGRLTEDLLVMARVESSDQELHPVPVRADVLLHDAVKSTNGLVRDRQATVEIAETSTAEVLADTDAVLQVLSNLIENGIKYGQSSDGAQAQVIVGARDLAAETTDGKGAVEFSVRDFGQGIASEHLSRIFERFYRVDKARSRASGGTGLGLAIARYVVESHGGKIWAMSDLNRGSTFLFTLPKA